MRYFKIPVQDFTDGRQSCTQWSELTALVFEGDMAQYMYTPENCIGVLKHVDL